ncbi:hypothetical protein V495_00877 [Pseudogymnoascus sp. VKM F-4514 (FW-929)]|nr:hypothetical protein V495_00877 [Pseudogymnoascus sp. VKM F-4514 (FW-929)]KFY56506.1 hypothetical protein V497_06199 [Pseudogymnoascus sp. VKM F-4516 (FW-969)]
MVTRAAAKREAEFLSGTIAEKSALEEQSKSLPVAMKQKRATKKKTAVVATQVTTESKVISRSELGKELVAGPLLLGRENAMSTNGSVSLNQGVQGKANGANDVILNTLAKKISRKRKIDAINGEPVKGGWDELPHNLGAAAGNSTDGPAAPITPPDSVPRTKTRTSRAKKTVNSVVAIKDEEIPALDPEAKQGELLGSAGQEVSQAPKGARRRAPKKNVKDAEALTETKCVVVGENELTDGPKPEAIEVNKVAVKPKIKAAATKAGTQAKRVKLSGADDAADADFNDQKPKKAPTRRVAKKVDTSQDVQDEVDKLIEGSETLKKVKKESKPKKPKKNKYGLTPGETPYPDFEMPTAAACLEVNNLLSGLHGVVEPPKAIPPPSLEVTGCGEVPSVLDALIRTRLSAATTSKNSAYAFAGLVSKFGILEEGIGKGSVNWNKVREASVKDIEAAIIRGGLAPKKSADIKAILDMVHEENIARREAFIDEKLGGEKVDVVGAESLGQGQKDMEIAVADKEILSLQYMHGLTPDEAMTEFTKYPGIGVKTASCVILFCLRRPSFAVDTHVHRLCRWLKWIPDNANENKAFSHCEVRIPNELKYSLHQLFIRHGRTCGRCRASTSETSEAWKETVCPIDHLVERSGLRKIRKPEGKMKKNKKGDDEDSDSELSEPDEAIFDDYLGNGTEMTSETTPETKDD